MSNSAWTVGIIAGVISSLLVVGIDSVVGGARLSRNGAAIIHTQPDIDGIMRISVPLRNTGVRPGGIRQVDVVRQYGNQADIRITDQQEFPERLFPLEGGAHAITFVFDRITNAPLNTIFRLRFIDTDGDPAFEASLAIHCDNDNRCAVIL